MSNKKQELELNEKAAFLAPKKVQFAFWEDDGEGYPYWMLFDTLEGAANEAAEREIFRMTAEPIGHYKVETKAVRLPKKKSKKK